MMNPEYWTSLFSPKQRIQTTQGVEELPGGRGLKQWIIARSCCHYRCFSFPDVPANKRISALKLKLEQWSPFQEIGFHVVWFGDFGQTWIWDEQKHRQHNHQELSKPIPETRLYKQPTQDVVRLIQCAEGVEAQHWTQGILHNSRWWPEPPESATWQTFLRASGLGANHSLCAPEKLALQTRPWGKTSALSSNSLQVVARPMIYICGLLAIFFLSLVTTEIIRLQQGLSDQEQQITELKSSIDPILKAKIAAYSHADKAAQLAALWPDNRQLNLWKDVITSLPKQWEISLHEWHYKQGHLSFVLSGTRLNPETIVRNYQNLDWSREVTLKQQGASSMRIDVVLNTRE